MVESIVRLLETLMLPVSIDAMGRITCWIHTPLGQQIVLDRFDPSARRFWLPAVLRAATVWQQLDTLRLAESGTVQ